MNGWHLTFNYRAGANAIELDITGNQAAIQMALGLALATLSSKLPAILARGKFPDGLVEEALMLRAISGGMQGLSAYAGKFLNIESVKKIVGLTSSVLVEWED